MALKVNWKTPSHSGIGIYFAFEFFFVNSYRFNEVPWEKLPIWSCLEMSTAQSTLLAHYSHQDQFASLFLGLKVFERISFAPEQSGVEHLCTIYIHIIYRYSIKVWWERERDCKCTDFIPGATGVRRSRRQWHRRKLQIAGTNPTKPAKVEPRRAPSQLGGKTHRTNLSVLHFNGGQPQARKMPCQKDGTRTQRTTSLDTGDTVSPMHHASNARMKPGSYHVGNLPRNRCDWSGWLLGANVTDLFGAENTIPNLQNGNGLLSVQLIQKYSPKSKTVFTKLAKPDVSTLPES